MSRSDDLCNLFKKCKDRVIFNWQCLLRSYFLNLRGKGEPSACWSPQTLSFWSSRRTVTTSGPVRQPSPPDTAEIPVSWPLFPENTIKAPDRAGGRFALTNYRSKMDCLDKM